MAPTNFEKAESERSVITVKLQLMDSQVVANATTPLLEHEVDSYLRMANNVHKEIEDNFKALQCNAPKTIDMTPYNEEFVKMTTQAIRLHAAFHGMKMQFPVAATYTPPVVIAGAAAPPTVTNKIKLPALELPKFSGNLQEWVPFRDLFITAVHNSSLSKVEKLTQLKSLLTGEAQRQVRSLVLSDANYDIAWKTLEERYENNRELLFTLLRQLITYQPIQSASAASVRSLIDNTKECIRSLEVLSMPTQHWDAIILYLLFTKMDSTSKELWEQSLIDTSIPAVSKMFEFLEQRARALAAGNPQHNSRPQQQQAQRQPERRIQTHHTVPGYQSKCKVGCSVFHPIYKCPVFKQQTSHQRLETLRRNNLCFNCFMENHSSTNCQNQHNCKVCNQRYHTMLHSALTTDGGSRVAPPTPPPIVNGHTQASYSIQAALLATAAVRVTSSQGEDFQCRAFLDNGSSVSFITESTARRLKLKLHPNSTPVTGLSASHVGIATHSTSIVIKPHFDCITTYNVNVLVINRISSDLPTVRCDPSDWPHIRNLQLADPRFGDPAPVDLLLGSDVFWNILGNEKITGSKGQPLAIKSSLGWLIAGQHTLPTPVNAFITNAQLDASLQRFWDQEEVQEEPVRSREEEECKKHFAATHRLDDQGQFVVSIPWKNPQPQLGDSQRRAVQRLISLENRLVHKKGIKDVEKLKKLTTHWDSYKGFMREYEALGHMIRLHSSQINNGPSYYIPNHFVVKESSTTTKLLVVFDASAPTSNGVSLNSCMMVSPQIQDNLFHIMLRFRIHIIAFTADVEKMYRQISVREEDRCFQRILWREDPALPIQDTYHFKIELPDMEGPPTKRIVPSEISKTIDPCGWLAPALISFKMFMQELWKTNLAWDSQLPPDLQKQWEQLRSSLHHVEKLHIPRCVIPANPERVMLCGFSDASIKAYSAVVYVCCTYASQPSSSFILTSKTRVAPVRAVTLPRLELCGSGLLSELLQTAVAALQLPIDEIRAFTDSTITLCWIQGEPSRWKTYVRNRVQTIKNNIPSANWFHVPGERNPADCASRGIPSAELLTHPLWWNAVPEAFQKFQHHPFPEEDEIQAIQSEEKPISCHFAAPVIPDLFTRFSSFLRFQRVMAWCFRFAENCRRKENKHQITTPLSTAEQQRVHNSIVRMVQSYHFADEIQALKNKEDLSRRSKLFSLHPFLSDDGLFRVGGRIRNTNLPFHRRFPILLPRAHHITTSIISDTHLRYLHTGLTCTIGMLNQQNWIVRVRDAVRLVIKVLVRDERLSPLEWNLGRVVALHPGKDGHVRVATIKTADGEIKRPIVKLSLLPISN